MCHEQDILLELHSTIRLYFVGFSLSRVHKNIFSALSSQILKSGSLEIAVIPG